MAGLGQKRKMKFMAKAPLASSKFFFNFMIFLLHQFYDFLVASIFNFPQIFEKFIP